MRHLYLYYIVSKPLLLYYTCTIALLWLDYSNPLSPPPDPSPHDGSNAVLRMVQSDTALVVASMLDSVPYGIETNGHEMVAERLPGSRLLQPAVVCVVFLFFFWPVTAVSTSLAVPLYALSKTKQASLAVTCRVSVGESRCRPLRADCKEGQPFVGCGDFS